MGIHRTIDPIYGMEFWDENGKHWQENAKTNWKILDDEGNVCPNNSISIYDFETKKFKIICPACEEGYRLDSNNIHHNE